MHSLTATHTQRERKCHLLKWHSSGKKKPAHFEYSERTHTYNYIHSKSKNKKRGEKRHRNVISSIITENKNQQQLKIEQSDFDCNENHFLLCNFLFNVIIMHPYRYGAVHWHRWHWRREIVTWNQGKLQFRASTHVGRERENGKNNSTK